MWRKRRRTEGRPLSTVIPLSPTAALFRFAGQDFTKIGKFSHFGKIAVGI